jgi:F0F1-type ATP synthase delta subunit
LRWVFFETVWKHAGEPGVKTFEKELNLLTWSVRKDPEWELTQSPLVSLEEKNKIVTERLKKLGCSDFFITQILSLVQSENLPRLNQIRFDYEEIMRAYRREIDVSLITKTPLAADVLEFYKRTIRLNFLNPKDNIIFTHQVDPEISHGYRVELGGQLFDFTWNKDQETMKQKLETINDKSRKEAQETFSMPLPDWDAALKVFDHEGLFESFKNTRPAQKVKLPQLMGGFEIYKLNHL